jgi:hypothetical protein
LKTLQTNATSEEPEDDELFDESFDEISYESRPTLTADQVKQEPFEKLKVGYTNQSPTKRTPSGTFLAHRNIKFKTMQKSSPSISTVIKKQDDTPT